MNFMGRIAYIDGSYVPHSQAVTHIEDRGYQFADGVYEVIGIYKGQFIDENGHIVRLERSLKELQMDSPVSREALKVILREIKDRNKITCGFVYFQITRGIAPRNHAFPKPSVLPILSVTATQKPLPSDEQVQKGMTVITMPDIRWQRCDIKSISLLGNIMCKQKALDQGASEAWLIDDNGYITEGTASNAWIITKDNTILTTRDSGNEILSGITRTTIFDIADKESIKISKRSFTVDDVKKYAAEAFLSSSTNFVMPVVSIDGTPIGDGRAGELTLKLRELYIQCMDIKLI
jgi:D-alanine transaminase